MTIRDVKKVVVIDLDEAIGRDINGWNDYLSELTGEDYLQDIRWAVVGLNREGILLEVTGYVDSDFAGETDPEECSHEPEDYQFSYDGSLLSIDVTCRKCGITGGADIDPPRYEWNYPEETD